MRNFRYAVAGAIATVGMLFTISAPASAQTATSPLSAARYTAFDQGYTFEIALDRDVTTPRLDNLERHCATLDPADPLQSVLLEDCLVSVKGYAATAAFGDCESRVACLRTLHSLQPLLKKALRVMRKANGVFDAEIPAGACRRAVRASSTKLRSGDILVTALEALERALRTGSAKARRQANRLIDSAARVSARVPSSTKQRKAFRSACGPGPVVPAPPPPAPVL
jgi:hypothetical protein